MALLSVDLVGEVRVSCGGVAVQVKRMQDREQVAVDILTRGWMRAVGRTAARPH